MKKYLLSFLFVVISVIAFSQITLTSTVTNVSCFGGSNGSATVTASGGTGAYTYTWILTATTSSIITGLAAGTYTVNVEDALANTSSLVVTITEPPQLTAATSATNSNCGQANGKTCAIATGGFGSLTYMWSNGVTTICNANVVAGAYTFTVTDANACLVSASCLVNDIAGPVVSIASQTNVSCFNGNNGAANANVTGGVAPYVYTWAFSTSTISSASNLSAGINNLTVIDIAGCVGTASVNITEPTSLVSAIGSSTNVLCFGSCNGGANALVNGGTPPYIYSWTNGSVGPTAINLCMGNYGVTITDANGCTMTQTVNVTQPTQLNASAYSNPACNGLCVGTGNAYAFGGTAPYQFLWSNGDTNIQTPNLCPGNYSVQITDANNCVSQQTINVYPLTVTVTASYTNTSCGGNCDGSIVMGAMGGSAPYWYQWTPNVSSLYYANNLCAGNYTFTATEGNGCVGTSVITISNTGPNGIPNATLTTVPYNETCLNSGDGSIDLNITGTNPGPFTYAWNNGTTLQDALNLNSGNYSVTVYDASMNCLTVGDYIAADGINCGTIQGHVYIDNNGDCVQNSGDNNFTGASVIVNPGNRIGSANYYGDYIINNLPYGTYSVSLNMASSGSVFPSCTTTLVTTINSGNLNSLNNILSVGFNSGTQPDMKVSAFNQGVVPGFVCRMNYNLSNLNNVNGIGLFKVTLPSSFIPTIVNATPGYSISGDTVIWSFSNIVYSIGTPYYFIDFTTPLSTPLGSTFISCMWVEPNITDFNYANNTFCYQRTVNGSFDPNDKTVSPVGIGVNGNIAATETDLNYLIRFQNTGNGPAVNIVVKDTLSPNVDITTFEMLSASHNYNIDILDGNILRWKFNNIMLADSNSNEPASHGYIQYRIKRTNNNTPGIQIKNTAYIYFDFNAPVVTNTAINTIETVTGIKSQSSTDNEWNIYPNPSNGVLYIVNHSSFKEASQIQVLNAIGQMVFEETITSNYKNINLSKLNNGIYFVKIVSDNQSTVKRIVLSK